MLDIGLTSVEVFGFDVSAIAGSLPSFEIPNLSDVDPVAGLATISEGVDAALLNRRQYLDVVFESPTTQSLDVASILDEGAEFTLGGAGLLDAEIDRVEQLEDNTFRYHLRDKNLENDLALFGEGGITITFAPDGWSDTDGVGNEAASDEFMVRDGGAESGSEVNIGPLKLKGPHIGLEDFQFMPSTDGGLGGHLQVSVGIGVDHAELTFGGDSSVLSTSVDGLLGTFDIGVDVSLSDGITGGSLGKFRVEVDSLGLEIENVLSAEANGIVVEFDPQIDKNGDGMITAEEQAAYDNQEILVLQDASLTITPINLTGSVGPYTRDSGETILEGIGNDLLLGKYHVAHLVGGDSDNNLDGSTFRGMTRLDGRAGRDTLHGSSNIDSLIGGTGNDLILGNDGDDVINGQGGDDSVLGGNGNDLILGGSGRDTLDGQAGDDDLQGQGSSGDRLTGGTGQDTIDGGDGVDVLVESADQDFLLTNSSMQGAVTGTDQLVSIEEALLAGGGSNNLIDAAAFAGYATLLGGAGQDTLTSAAGGSVIKGEAGADLIFGSDVADKLFGGDDNDTINAGAGSDQIAGNIGRDVINSGEDIDTIFIDALDEVFTDPEDVLV